MKTLPLFSLFLLTSLTISEARLIPNISLQELFDQADVVAVIDPQNRETTADQLQVDGHESSDFQGYNTSANVLILLKKPEDLKAPESLTILHFQYSQKVTTVNNGALFITLPNRELELEKRVLLEGNQIIKRSHVKWHPSYLAFLKRTDDGRYVPVTRQYDAAQSFVEMDDPVLGTSMGRDLP